MSGSANMFIFFHPFLGLCCLISDYFLLRQDELIFFCFCVIGDKINEGDIDITASPPMAYQLSQMVPGNTLLINTVKLEVL